MKTIQELINHLKTHKDAVIIIGPGLNSEEVKYTTDEFNENYNRKNLKRDPKRLWDFFNDKIRGPLSDKKGYDLVNQIDHALILDQNINGSTAASYLHGHVNIFMCQKCKTLYTQEYVYSHDPYEVCCETCEGTIRPTVLLSGERYNQGIFDEFKEALLNAHTVILVGIDYTEDAILNLIADYGDMKAQLNAEGKDTRCLVAIQSIEEEFNPNEITYFEFLVKDDIDSSLGRLLKAYGSN